MILFSAWGPPAQKYVCEICVVEVPCYDTLVKHKRGKEHIKREKDLEASFQTINLGINWHPSQQRWKNVRILRIYPCYFCLTCANFLAVYAQTDYKHCAVLYCAKSN